jgi:RimJ/RimL family protein N-acetyltransferase
MRGYIDESGKSPFWEAVGRNFFEFDYYAADVLSGLGEKEFIADLMPRHPMEMEGEREVGYWLGREFWGRGIATEALSQFLGVVKTRPLFAHVAKHNHGSRRVLEKCGFKVIGEDKYTIPANDVVEENVLKLD